MTFLKVAKLSDLSEGKIKLVPAGDENICLIMSGGKVYAVQEYCTHEDGPLSEGFLEDGKIVCPWHQAKFDIKTGKVDPDTNWTKRDLKTYKVRVKGEDVLVDA
jgi:3-phenylpropionate/trans-cinnamate dioxygenase ferredoxin subunit